MPRVKRSHKVRCPKEYITTLRSALIDESGRDRDVSADVGAFMKYNKIEGFDLEIQFATKFLLKDGKWALDLTRRNMKEKYNESGYSWCDADKKEELIEHGGAARFLIARKKRTHTDDSHRPMAFIHFRFTLQGEAVGVEGGQPAVYIMDIQLEPEVQRKGLGRHLMRTVEMIARKQGMMHLMIPLVVKDEGAKNWVLDGLNGFKLDDLSGVASYDGQDPAALLYEDATFNVYSKELGAVTTGVESSTSTPAKKGVATPSDGELSAASTPEKDEVASGGFGLGSSTAAAAPPVAFDPTFGAAGSTSKGAETAADALLVELKSRGVIPESMGSEAKVLLNGLMMQYQEAHGRAPNGDDIAKWLVKIAEHAAEDAAAQGEEEDESEDEDNSDDDEGESDEDDAGSGGK